MPFRNVGVLACDVSFDLLTRQTTGSVDRGEITVVRPSVNSVDALNAARDHRLVTKRAPVYNIHPTEDVNSEQLFFEILKYQSTEFGEKTLPGTFSPSSDNTHSPPLQV